MLGAAYTINTGQSRKATNLTTPAVSPLPEDGSVDQTGPAADVAVTPTEPVTVAPTAQLVAMTNEQLQQLLATAVAAAVAQAQASIGMSEGARLAAGPVPVELPTLWTENQFMHHLVARTKWYNEREERSARYSVDTLYPIPEDPADSSPSVNSVAVRQ